MKHDLLTVNGLTTTFLVDSQKFAAVDHVSFSVDKGESVGLVGESGCGKSVTSLSILRLIQSPPGFIEHGEINFCGNNILKLPTRDLRKIRGNKISMIFQEPMTSLNPVFTIGDQVSEVFRIHQKLSRRQALDKAKEMLSLVKIPAPEKRIDEYPHQLSGGMRQRVMIAMALACKPELLIADEPTTALDVTIQAQILYLIEELQQKLNMSLLLITHDLAVVAETCDRVLVMYAGKIIEEATSTQIFNSPRHPYTIGLLNSIPKLGKKIKTLPTIKGSVPALGKFPQGCRFQNRCPKAQKRCSLEQPKLEIIDDNHKVACWYAE